MDLQAATPEQIAAFQKGAADRYAEKGLDHAKAQALYGAFMSKTAEAMGFMSAEQTARVDGQATKIASVLGRKRPAPVSA